MKKLLIVLTIGIISIFSISTLPTLLYSSRILDPECTIEAEIVSIMDNSFNVLVLSTQGIDDSDYCPLEEGQVFELTYDIRESTVDGFEEGYLFGANVGRLSTRTEAGKDLVVINWFDFKDSDGNNISIQKAQSSNIPLDTIDLSDDSVTTIIDENTKEVSNRYFDLTLERKPQSAFGQHVPYILTITPHLDSRRTQIIWNMPTTLTVNPKHKEFVDLIEGETYTFKANVKAIRGGTYDFSVSAIAWEHDTNYTNSIEDRVVFNNNLVLQPVSSQYQVFTILKFVLIFLVFLGICFLVARALLKVSPKVKQWLTPPM